MNLALRSAALSAVITIVLIVPQIAGAQDCPTDVLYIGACKYNVLKIERSESRGGGPLAFRDTDYYSADLKLIIAKEYRRNDQPSTMIKFDRISPLKR